jgi:hypothetical protein
LSLSAGFLRGALSLFCGKSQPDKDEKEYEFKNFVCEIFKMSVEIVKKEERVCV